MAIKRVMVFLAGGALLCAYAHAQVEVRKPPSVAVQTSSIIEVVNFYARAVACGSENALSGKDIAAMTPLTDMDKREDAKFAVIWYGDFGCQGGSGTTAARLAIVGVGSGDTFYVNPYESEPAQDAGLPRSVEKIVGATKDTLIFDVRDYASNDANCCPSLRKRVTIKQLPSGKWQRISTTSLPPAKY